MKKILRPILQPIWRPLLQDLTYGGTITFNISKNLFGSSEPGAWYDPSDYANTMFQDF